VTALLGPRTRPLRASLSALGVAIGVASLVAVVGISASSRADLLARLDQLGTNLLKVAPGQTFLGETATLPVKAEPMIARIAPVQASAAVRSTEASVRRSPFISEQETGGISVSGADPDLLAVLAGTVRSGRFLDAATIRVPAVVLGATAAARLGIDRIGSIVYLGGQSFTVVGILDPVALAPELDTSALVGRPIAERLLDADDTASSVYVRTHPDRVTSVRDVLGRTANPLDPEQVEVSRPSDALAAKAEADSAFTSLLLGLGAVALVVGAIGIANVMVVAVLERRNEIGLRRALGATKRAIRTQFLFESLVIGTAGGLLGLALGSAVTAGYAARRGWTVDVPPLVLAGGFAAALVCGALAGVYPAIRASRLAPTEALRAI
jgi:putative ABC transport system permease protein